MLSAIQSLKMFDLLHCITVCYIDWMIVEKSSMWPSSKRAASHKTSLEPFFLQDEAEISSSGQVVMWRA